MTIGMLFSWPSTAGDTRSRIAVIDTGIRNSSAISNYLCEASLDKDFTGRGMHDAHGHGTNIANIIANKIDPSKHCIVIIKWFDSSAEYDVTSVWHQNHVVGLAVRHAVSIGAKYINLSLYGPAPNEFEKAEIEKALKAGVKVVVAAGNKRRDLSKLCDAFPACYGFNDKNFYVVANYTELGPADSSNYSGPVNYKANGSNITAGGFTMSGTSQAAAVCTGTIARQYD